MSVTVEQIADRLGVTTPPAGSAQYRQWMAWIGDADALIELRASVLGVDRITLDQATQDRVIALAVVAMARKPDDSEQVDVQIDDGRVSRRWASSPGQVQIAEDWWAWLGLVAKSGAFSVRPHFMPDRSSFSEPNPIAGAVDVIPPTVWP